jgi:hypothetical protein
VSKLNDLQEFFNSMIPTQVGANGYTEEDRYRDFRSVFFDSPSGKRVLHQIIAECEGLPVTLRQIESHAHLAFRAGKREVGMHIVKWMQGVPAETPVDFENTEDEWDGTKA